MSSTELFTFSNEKGEIISYIPDLSNEGSCEEHFNNIQKQFKQKFGIYETSNLDIINITYNPHNNVNSINATKLIVTNVLSSTNISQFWDLLTSSENQSCSVTNVKIGDIGGKKATIICVESIKKMLLQKF